MLQKVCELFKKSIKVRDTSITHMNILPIFIPLKNFTIREINDKQIIFFHDISLIELNENINDQKKIYNFWSRLLSIAIRNRGSEFWGKVFIKLFINSNFLLFGDGWDELTPHLKDFLAQFILITIKNTRLKLKYIFSTRYLERSLSPLIRRENGKDNIIKLEFPTNEQILKYFVKVDINWIKADDKKDIIDKRFGNKLTPMSLWLLGLFPNFENLPQNSAELYDRWIKYEVLREISDKLNEKLGKPFYKTIKGIKNYKDLEVLLDESYSRKIDGKKFPLMQYILGPIPGLIEDRNKKKKDYGLLKLLPKLVYNRFLKHNYFFNYYEIIQMNPLFNRFIRCYNDERNHPNFALINSHYDYYLAAMHCFHNYLDGEIFDFLENFDRKKGLDSEIIERIVYQSNPSNLIKSLFIEILNIKSERRENDFIQGVRNNLILLRNIYDSIPIFNDQVVGHPLNQSGPFIFKLQVRNFIDPYYQQVYKFYWDSYLKQRGHLPTKEDLEWFKNIQKSVINDERTIRNLLKDILKFQDLYLNNKTITHLADLCDIVKIETPYLIPIIIYAFEINQTEIIPAEYLKKLEKSEFMELPWIKIWVYRAIIRESPDRIKELCYYALKHTKHYLLKFCALNIINPIKKEIEEKAFDLSIELFERVTNKYKEIIIFMWSSHILTEEQLNSIKKIEKDSYYYKIHSRKIIFDLQYLLLLHRVMPNQFNIYQFDFQEIPPKKTLTFLINLHNSMLVSEEDFAKFFAKVSLKSLIFIHRTLMHINDEFFSNDEIKQIITPKFKNLALTCCDAWWKKNTPYHQADLMKMLEEMKSHFISKGNYQENKEFENQEFRLKKYLENLIELPESEKKQIFSKGKEILNELLQREKKSSRLKFLPITNLKNFYEIFYKWLIIWNSKDVLMEFYLEFRNDFDFDDFFFRLLNKIENKTFNELFPTIRQHIKENPKKYLLSSVFKPRRKTHPHLVSKNSNYNGSVKFKLITNIFSQEELYDLLLQTYDLSNNDDLLNYIYNLCNIGSEVAFNKIARLWDDNYVDKNRIANEDPSFYIWCGIPYELLDQIYPFLRDPIAKIFYNVCLSIRDTFRPRRLDQKHSIKNENGIVKQLLMQFKQNELAGALIKFLDADWSFSHFKILCSFTELTPLLIENIVKNIRLGKLSVSSTIECKFKSNQNGKNDFLTQYFDLNPIDALNFYNEVMEYYNSGDKSNLFIGLLNSDNSQSIILASNFWERYENIISELRDLSLDKIENKILTTNNFNYIKKLKQAINPNIRDINDIDELNTLRRYLLRIERLIKNKIEDNENFENYNKESIRYSFRTFEYNLRQIEERELELEARNYDFDQFLEILKKENSQKGRLMMNARFPLSFSRKLDKSALWKKIDELNLINREVNDNDDIRDLTIRKNQNYQSKKEDFLKNPDRFTSIGETQEILLETSNSEINNLIMKELNIDLRVSINKLKLFLTNLKTPKAKKRAFYYVVDSYIKQREGYTSRYEINRIEFNKIAKTTKSMFENFLNLSVMEEILLFFEDKIKGETNSSVNQDQNNFSTDNDDDEDDYHFFNKKSHKKITKTEEELEKYLLSEELNIPFIEENLKFLGDGYEFTNFLNLLLEERESRYYDEEGLYNKIPSPTRKKLQKYLFYWILKQRETFHDKLSHDFVPVADESNQISDVDTGIFVDNLFEEVLINSIDYDFFLAALNYLKDVGRNDLYNKIKLFTLFQMQPGIKSIISVQYGNRSRLKIPRNKATVKAMSDEELKWSVLLYYSNQFYNVIEIQLFDLPQFLNGFKLRKKIKIDNYDDFSLDF